MRQLVMTIAALVAVTVMAPGALAYSDGFYFSFGVGYAHVMGDRGVSIQGVDGCPDMNGASPFLWSQRPGCIYLPGGSTAATLQARHEEVVRADGGSMLGLQFRLGYNILGHVSVEGALSGAGSGSLTDGRLVSGGLQAGLRR